MLREATDIETANTIARRLRSSIEELRIQHDRHEISATASFGVGQVKNGLGGWKERLAKCDGALYAEKDEGRKIAASVE